MIVSVLVCRTATARGKAELADMASDHAREDSEIARVTAKQFAPDFQQPDPEVPGLIPGTCRFICEAVGLARGQTQTREDR
ncbi:unnamed protein product [Timema podura]|uniref:Uncharacterized protein n=1 Tax=Timema podura TaxID=61482 RepID=A0ABN7PC71_TIMPD|nr:unnamed protein product [Timema podura]